MQICRICLALGRKMYAFDSNFLLLYEQITGLTEEKDLLPKFVCWECKYYMLKYNGFKSKAIENHCILTEILYKDGVMTESSIKAASLNHHKPTLACTEVCTDVCNPSTNSEIKIVNVKNEVDSPETEIKIETEEIGIDPDDSDNAREAKVEFVNASDSLITAKEEFIPETIPDVEKSSHDIDRDILTLIELTMDEQIAEMQTREDNYKKSPYKCENCFQGFVDDASFQRHMEKHAECPSTLFMHKYASSKQFKCDRCGKLFLREKNLHHHRRLQCGARAEHPCGVCGKTFATKYNLRKHMEKHKGIEYKCELCDKVFNCPLNRKAHMDYVHHKKPRPKRNKNKGTRKNKEDSGGEPAGHAAQSTR